MLHVGSVRTALFNYLFAKQQGGEFILRIEDTDIARSKKEYEDDILECLKWLGLEYSSMSQQSDRVDVYKKYLQKMLDDGTAYISKEEAKVDSDNDVNATNSYSKAPKDAERRSEVIRFKNPNKIITFTDLIRGEVSMDTSDLKDFVIAKSIDEPLYHLAVVVDDHESGVTHVIRGEDHISNTPRQILLQEAIGEARPVYAHLPLILATDRSKLSKRKHGEAVWLRSYIEQGYLKDAILNYMALLGWNPGGEEEVFTLDELITKFDLSKVQKGGAVFDLTKLQWMNKQHMNKLSMAEFDNTAMTYIPEDIRALPSFGERIRRVLPIIRERISVFGEIKALAAEGELRYFFEQPEYDVHSLICPPKLRKDEPAANLWNIEEVLSELTIMLGLIEEVNFVAEVIKERLWEYATVRGRGIVLWAMRYALSGKEKSPDPFVLAQVLGKIEANKRLQIAIDECLKAAK
jgi:nondiscriminating glutamyl-tRNA synthetase